MQLRFVRAAVTLTLASLLASCQDATGPAAARRGGAVLLALGYPGPADGWVLEEYHRL